MALLFPPTYIRSLKSVALFSAVAFFGAIVVIVCVIAHCGDILLEKGLPSQSDISWKPDSLGTFFATLPLLMSMFSIQAGGSIILSGLKDDSEANQAKVSTSAFIIVLCANLSVAIPAYLVYLSKVSDDVLEAMNEPGSPMIIAAKVGVLDLVVLSFMFMMIPCRVSLLEGLLGKNEGKQEASYT